jgi:hypothetical protein
MALDQLELGVKRANFGAKCVGLNIENLASLGVFAQRIWSDRISLDLSFMRFGFESNYLRLQFRFARRHRLAQRLEECREIH